MRISALPESYRISGGSNAGHGIAGLVRQNFHRSYLDSRYGSGIQPLLYILTGGQGMHFQVHIFSVAGQSHTQRCGKGHDLMRAEASGIGYVQLRSAVGFLEEAHYIQMANETYRSVFSEFDS